MNSASMLALVLIVVPVMSGCGEQDRAPVGADTETIYRSFVPEYYRRYYQGAAIDALGVPLEMDDELTEHELVELHAKLRRASRAWAEAPNQELRLGQTECVLSENDLKEVKGRSWLIPEPVIMRRVERRGTYKREGDQLTLEFERPNGSVAVIHARVEGDLLVFNSMRSMGPLWGDSVLVKTK